MSVTSKSGSLSLAAMPAGARLPVVDGAFSHIIEAQMAERGQQPAAAIVPAMQKAKPHVVRGARIDKRAKNETAPGEAKTGTAAAHASPVTKVQRLFGDDRENDDASAHQHGHEGPVDPLRAHTDRAHESPHAAETASVFDGWVFANPYDQQFWQGAYLYFSPPPYLYSTEQLWEFSFNAASAMPQALAQYNFTMGALLRPRTEAIGAAERSAQAQDADDSRRLVFRPRSP